MSYILDALRKAETERALNRVSCIASPQPCHTRPKRGWVRRFVYVPLVVVCTMSITWLWDQYEVAAEAQASTPAEGASIIAHTQEQPTMPNQPELTPPSVAPATPSEAWSSPGAAADIDTVTSLPEGGAEETSVMAAPDAEKSAPPTRVPRAVTKQTASGVKDNVAEVTLKKVTSSSSSPRADEQGSEVAMIEIEAEQGLSHSREEAPVITPLAEIEAAAPELPVNEELPTEEPLPPLLSTLPYRFQSTLPKIVINAQAYAEETGARFVIINMKKYQEGQQTEAGIMIEKIGEEHLVLSYQGQAFRMQR